MNSVNCCVKRENRKLRILDHIKRIVMLTALCCVSSAATAVPGYHINSDTSARRAVAEYADTCDPFASCVYQAAVDKSTWRLVLASLAYLKEKPESGDRECSFAQAYLQYTRSGPYEQVSAKASKELETAYLAALNAARDAPRRLPNSSRAHLTCGLFIKQFEMGFQKVSPMLTELRKAVQLSPASGECHRCLAEGYMSSGDETSPMIEKIIAESKLALKCDPRQTTSWFYMCAACCWPAKADYKAARIYLDNYLKGAPENNPGVPGIQKLLQEKLGKPAQPKG